MKLVIVLSLFVSLNAHAASYEQFFLVSGHKATAEEAILAALKGQEAFRCQSVEAKVSKAGTSIGIRNVKRPRKE